jgi:hypothetical protein
MRNFIKIASFSLALYIIAIVGCTSRMLDFTVVSNKNVNLQIKEEGKGPRVSGSHHIWWVLWIPMGSASLEEAVDRAIEKAGPGYDALIDGVIYNQFYFYFFTSKSGYKVEGTPVRSSEIISEWTQRGRNIEEAKENILFHSSTGKDNNKNFERIKKALNQDQLEKYAEMISKKMRQ